MFEKFTEGAIKVIMLSQEEARRMGHNFVGTEQLLLGVIGQRHGVGGRALTQLNVTLKKTRKEIEKYIGRGTGFVASEIPFTPRAKRVLEMSIHEGQDLGVNYVGTEHILLSLINEVDGVAMRTLDKIAVNIPKLRHLILSYIEEQQEEVLKPPLTDQEKWAIARTKSGQSPTPTLDEYASDLTKLASDGHLDPVIGRKEEIEGLIKVLGRRRKNNPVLLGEAGVGKTACAEGLAQIMNSSDCPAFLDKHVVLVLDLGSVLAGTKYRGEFEERMKRILEDVKAHGKIVLVIDEIHTIVGAGAAEGAVDAANLLKPALARGSLRMIGATTLSEYRRYIEKDPALERRFQPILVEEPSVETTICILQALKPEFEKHHCLQYEDIVFDQAAKLSDRFVADRNLPDKAIDVADEAGSRVRLENRELPMGIQKLLMELHATLKDKNKAVREHDFQLSKAMVDHEMEVRTHIRVMKYAMRSKSMYNKSRKQLEVVIEQDVAKVIASWTGIPVAKINQDESEKLRKMEDHLHKRLIGQHQAIIAASNAVRRSRSGLADPKRPIASFIFAGPTGVGKTELTKALAEYMFNSDKNMIRFDMSEYMEKHTVAKLIGSPPGYVGFQDGGQLTEAVRLRPYSIVLFDEVEKAHPDVFNLFLQILDDGHLSDSTGREVSFKNTIIVMTTNLGSKIIENNSPFLKDKKLQDAQKSDFLRLNSEESNRIHSTLVEVEISSQGNISIKPPVQPEITDDDKVQFGKIKELVTEELKKFFRPEFLNRIDDIIVFDHLTKNNLWEICGLLLEQVGNRLKDKEITLIVDNAVRYYITEEGYDPIYGARPLRRAITRILENRLAMECLGDELLPGTVISISLELKDPSMGNVMGSTYNEFENIFTENLEIDIDTSSVDDRQKKIHKNRQKWQEKEDKGAENYDLDKQEIVRLSQSV